MQPESALERCERIEPCRPLPVALAHVFANAKPADPRMPALNRIFTRMAKADQLRCRDELHWCRLAKRGELKAVVQ